MNKDTLPPLPERDSKLTNKGQGVYRKFDVRRTDCSDQPGGKHHGCEYFVLDVTHDPHAKAALQKYADECESSHMTLAADMRDRYGLEPAAIPAQAPQQRLDDYATEINRLRNVIQAACLGGTDAMIERWIALFPDAPVPEVKAMPDAFPALHALTEAIMTRAGPELVLRRINEAVSVMATRGWSPPIPWPAAAPLPLPVQAEPKDGPGTWEENVSLLLDRCPYTVRQREGGGPECLISTLVVTFTGMQMRLQKDPMFAKPQQPAPAAPQAEPIGRTLLEQYDLEQLPEYRKGYEDGRLNGYAVGHRHASTQSPAAQEPLTEQQAIDLLAKHNGGPGYYPSQMKLIRAAEAAHGITGAAK